MLFFYALFLWISCLLLLLNSRLNTSEFSVIFTAPRHSVPRQSTMFALRKRICQSQMKHSWPITKRYMASAPSRIVVYKRGRNVFHGADSTRPHSCWPSSPSCVRSL
ncbi:hypothetical protein BX666DRAFT_67762 [Dichotomocladium elegans]|nr:hypothetical protein BX666DRAFT_67762 [Dichotomocladium elegans]